MHVLRILAPAVAVPALMLAGAAGAGEKDPRGTGSVETLRLDAHGKPTGVILSDGTELVGDAKTKDLMRVAVPGDPVRVTTDADDRLVLVNGRNHETTTLGPLDGSGLKPLIHNPLGIGGGPPVVATEPKNARIDDAASLDRYAVTERVSLVLKTKVGAPSGLLLEDGTQVHVIPRFSGALAGITPGMALRIEGVGTPRQRDASMWALSISRGDYVFLDVERGEGAPELNITGPFEGE